jgi:hypothetical protein
MDFIVLAGLDLTGTGKVQVSLPKVLPFFSFALQFARFTAVTCQTASKWPFSNGLRDKVHVSPETIGCLIGPPIKGEFSWRLAASIRRLQRALYQA